MAISALQMVTDALVLANVIARGDPVSAEMGNAGLRTLNQMMTQLDRDGVKLGWYVVPTLQTNLPLDTQDEEGVKYQLALKFAGEEGIEPTAYVVREAARTMGGLEKAHRARAESQLDHLPQASSRYISRSVETG